MAFSIEYEKLKQMDMLNENTANVMHGGDIFIENEDTLLKAVTTNCKKQLEYLSTIPEHDHVIKPIEVGKVIYNNDKVPKNYSTIYRMKYLQNAKTLLSLYYKDIPYEVKVQYANEIFSALQFLHQYIIVGDIHAKNIWIDNGKAYLGDLDNSKKLHSVLPIQSAYYLSIMKNFEHSKRTDIIKLYIECLSFICNINLASFINQYGYKDFYKTVINYNPPKEIKNFLNLSCNKKEFNQLGSDAYQFEHFISPEALKLEKKLGFMDPYRKFKR